MVFVEVEGRLTTMRRFMALLLSVFFLLSTVLLSGCGPTLKPYPKWPKRSPIIYSFPQVNPRCGKEQMKKEPKSRAMEVEGKKGVWMSNKRVQCLLARSKIGRKCRGSCFELLGKYKQADKFVQNTVTTAWENHVISLKHAHSKQIRDMTLIGSAVGVVLLFLGSLIGYGYAKTQQNSTTTK